MSIYAAQKLLDFPEDRYLCHFFEMEWQMEFLKVTGVKRHIYSDNCQISVRAQEGGKSSSEVITWNFMLLSTQR